MTQCNLKFTETLTHTVCQSQCTDTHTSGTLVWLGTPIFIYEFMKHMNSHMNSYMKKSCEFMSYMNSSMNSYIWIHIHMNLYMKWSYEFIVYMNSYMKWSYEFMSIWIHVYEFICIDSEFVYEFIDIWILIWIHMYGLWIHISEFSNMNS